MNIAICDDEENIRIYIRKLIQKQETFCKITEFSSGKELLEFQDETNAEEIDILFLDISMGDEDGMTVAKQLRSQMESKKEAVWGSLPLLIFVTGYPEYMQEAFSVNAFQYIVKPIQEISLCDYYLVRGNSDAFSVYPFVKKKGKVTGGVSGCIYEYSSKQHPIIFTANTDKNIELVKRNTKLETIIGFSAMLLQIPEHNLAFL